MVAKKTAPARKAASKSTADEPAAPAGRKAARSVAGETATIGVEAGAGADPVAAGPGGSAAPEGRRRTAARTTAAKTGAGTGTGPVTGPVTAETAPAGTAAAKSMAKSTAKSTATSTAKTAVKKAAKAAPAKKAVPAKKTGASTVALKKTPGGASSASKDAAASANALPKARAVAGAADPGELAVRPGEDPWTPDEVAEARTELGADAERLRAEILAAEAAIAGLMRDSGDGAGDDQADTGTKNITREHELALASSARDRLLQTERALERLDAGTYGLCESCGKPIGKARMQAFPRATLCVECKQRQERR